MMHEMIARSTRKYKLMMLQLSAQLTISVRSRLRNCDSLNQDESQFAYEDAQLGNGIKLFVINRNWLTRIRNIVYSGLPLTRKILPACLKVSRSPLPLSDVQ